MGKDLDDLRANLSKYKKFGFQKTGIKYQYFSMYSTEQNISVILTVQSKSSSNRICSPDQCQIREFPTQYFVEKFVKSKHFVVVS